MSTCVCASFPNGSAPFGSQSFAPPNVLERSSCVWGCRCQSSQSLRLRAAPQRIAFNSTPRPSCPAHASQLRCAHLPAAAPFHTQLHHQPHCPIPPSPAESHRPYSHPVHPQGSCIPPIHLDFHHRLPSPTLPHHPNPCPIPTPSIPTQPVPSNPIHPWQAPPNIMASQ